MKIKLFTKYLLAASLLTGVVACQNPLKDFNLQISTEIVKHTTTLYVVDINKNPIPNTTVTLVGGEVKDIYNVAGTKNFTPVEGLITFGLDPNLDVNEFTNVRFRAEIKAPGYITQVVPFMITEVSTGLTVITLVKPTQVPETGGVQETQEVIDLAADGSTLVATAVEVPPVSPGEPQMTMTIPAGTQFKDANGNVIVGGHVTVNVGTFDGDNTDAVALLPGGSLTTDAVVGADGSTGGGSFTPAAITQINMIVNGVQVRQFSKPLEIGLPIDPSFVNPVTGLPIKAGDVIDIYSNSSSDNTWKFEKSVTVTGSAATGFYGNFTIDHLTWFLGGKFIKSCISPAIINFSAPWMVLDETYPVSIEARYATGKVVFARDYSISRTVNRISIADLPSEGVTLYIRKQNGELITSTPLANCNTVTNVTLVDPNPVPMVTLQLYVRCPNKETIITLLPTFEMFYKKSGTNDAYEYLGSVSNGFLRTRLLSADGTRYDFKAHYSNRVKEVKNKTVQVDNNATVGIKPGDIIGEKAGATNLAILKEECDKL